MATEYLQGRPVLGITLRLGAATLQVLIIGLTKLTERIAFSRLFPSAHILLPGIRWVLRDQLNLIESLFDESFYLRQLRAKRRRRAQADPSLHYFLFGSLNKIAPHPCFDAAFYSRNTRGLEHLRNPLLRYVTNRHLSEHTANECAYIRKKIDFSCLPDSAQAVLIFNHSRGGGSSHLLLRMESELVAQGLRIIKVRQVAKRSSLFVFEDLNLRDSASPPVFDLVSEIDSVCAYARDQRVHKLLINHFVDADAFLDLAIERISDRLGCDYDVVLHDYFMVCPRVTLIDAYARFCNIATTNHCRRCLRMGGSESFSAVDPAAWRERWSRFVSRASRVIAPSRDLADRIAPHIGRLPEVLKLGPDLLYGEPAAPKLQRHDVMKILVLGNISVPKGLFVLSRLGKGLRRRRAPISITVLGNASAAFVLRRAGVAVRGPYAHADLDDLVKREAPHAFFLPSIWPETWSFVLSEALRYGLPIFAFDIGAPAERLRHNCVGTLLPLEWAEDGTKLAEYFIAQRTAWINAEPHQRS